MKQRKTRNPLIKRIPRELIGDWRKYLLVSLFLILMVGFVSGMYVANGSMLQAAKESVSRYKLEDGHFELTEKAQESLLSAIEKGENDDKAVPVSVYENFYRNEEEDSNADGVSDGTIRVYVETENINLACLMEGRFPKEADEIAIDRMHADNSEIQVGDSIQVGGQTYEVVGLLAYVNYATLHEKSTDMMFDALKFDVAMVTETGFGRLDGEVHYAYAWHYKEAPADESKEKKKSDAFMKALVSQTATSGNELVDYLPRYANPAINFATEDMGSDKAMGGVLLDILIVIVAFIFAVTISNTITKEASTIGTLRASGYTKGEMVFHFLSMPVIVTFLGAGIGNILGYTVFKNVVVAMYYNSYSLPLYETIWSSEAFLKTTLVPVILMFVVNLVVIVRMMHNTPLQFLRHDLKKKKRKKALRLPKWRFLNRFRIRIILQNIPNYIILFVGISFIMVMLAMAVGMPSTLKYYKKNAADMMFAKYQYVLKSCQDEMGGFIETDNKNAEKFSMCSLQKKSEEITEEVSVYGIADDSSYVKIQKLSSLKEKEAYISASFADKYGLKAGDSVSLEEKYNHQKYVFKIVGIYDKCQSMAVFMPMENYNSVFETKAGEFTGYFSDEEITDIAEEAVATVITKREITKICNQLDHSMGSYMTYFQYLCVFLSAVLIYLLTKIIIEKNENAISMTKILGYNNREIAGLYLLSTTVVVIIADAVSVLVGVRVMKQAWKIIMFEYSGWYAFTMEPAGYAKMFIFVWVGYLIVMYFDFKRIKKVPMEEALKHIE